MSFAVSLVFVTSFVQVSYKFRRVSHFSERSALLQQKTLSFGEGHHPGKSGVAFAVVPSLGARVANNTRFAPARAAIVGSPAQRWDCARATRVRRDVRANASFRAAAQCRWVMIRLARTAGG